MVQGDLRALGHGCWSSRWLGYHSREASRSLYPSPCQPICVHGHLGGNFWRWIFRHGLVPAGTPRWLCGHVHMQYRHVLAMWAFLGTNATSQHMPTPGPCLSCPVGHTKLRWPCIDDAFRREVLLYSGWQRCPLAHGHRRSPGSFTAQPVSGAPHLSRPTGHHGHLEHRPHPRPCHRHVPHPCRAQPGVQMSTSTMRLARVPEGLPCTLCARVRMQSAACLCRPLHRACMQSDPPCHWLGSPCACDRFIIVASLIGAFTTVYLLSSIALTLGEKRLSQRTLVAGMTFASPASLVCCGHACGPRKLLPHASRRPHPPQPDLGAVCSIAVQPVHAATPLAGAVLAKAHLHFSLHVDVRLRGSLMIVPSSMCTRVGRSGSCRGTSESTRMPLPSSAGAADVMHALSCTRCHARAAMHTLSCTRCRPRGHAFSRLHHSGSLARIPAVAGSCQHQLGVQQRSQGAVTLAQRCRARPCSVLTDT